MNAIPVNYSLFRFAGFALWCMAVAQVVGLASQARAGGLERATWFPDPPAVKKFIWSGEACVGCKQLAPREEWRRMAALAGLGEIRFLLDPKETNGQAWSAAPDMVVLSPSALKLPACQLAFVVGHELVHVAQRHFDEDALELMLLSGKPASWTRTGEKAMSLLDGDFVMALRMSSSWQQQEWEADWVGSMLAAQACGCSLEKGALSYLRTDSESGGGLAASHDTDSERITSLRPFADSARRLVERY